MRSRFAVAASAVFFALALGVSPASAQGPGGEGLLGLGIHVSALGGPATALADLGTIRSAAGNQAFTTELNPGWAIGGAVEVPVGRSFSVRADARATPGAEMFTESLTCPVGGATSEPQHCAARSQGTLWTATGGVVYETVTTPGTPSAFIHAGVGVKRYDFSTAPTVERLGGEPAYTGECVLGDSVCEVHVDDGFAGEHTDVTGRVGFGVSMSVGGVRLAGELADYVSVFAPADRPGQQELQHELFLTLEVAPRL